MPLIIFNQLIFIIICTGFGILFCKIFNLKKIFLHLNIFDISLFGLIFMGFLSQLVNFFFPLNDIFLLTNLILSVLLIFYFFKEYKFRIVQAPMNIFDRRLILSGWGKKLIKNKVEIFARSVFLKGLLLRDFNKIPVNFFKWNQKFLKFEKWIKKEQITKAEACIRFVKSFKEIKRIILGVNDLDQLKENIIFLNEQKLIAPKNLAINSGLILNPKKWKI